MNIDKMIKKMKKTSQPKEKRTLALSQIFILIVGIIAVSYAIGSEVGIVSAATSFTYKNRVYTIIIGNKITRADGLQYIKDTSSPCTLGGYWFWDKNSNGAWDSTEQSLYDGGEGICMLPSFKDAVNSAIATETTEKDTDKKTDEEPSVAKTGVSPEQVEEGEYYLEVEGEDVPIPKGAVTEDDEGNIQINDESAFENIIGTGSEAYGTYQLGKDISGEIKKIGTVESSEKGLAASTTAVKETGKFAAFLKKPFLGELSVGYIFKTAAVASATAVAIHYIAKLAGAGERNLRGIDWAAGISALGIGGISILSAALGAGPPGWLVAATITAITAIYSVFQYQLYSQEVFTFQPTTWQPQDGGKDCEKCNKLEYGCSEYQCHSFGRACELVNKGTDYEKCVWKDPNDITPPIMDAMESVLPEGYRYKEPDVMLPPDRGVQIFNPEDDEGCIPAFSSVILGVNTSEPAECKIDVARRAEFEEMVSYMGEGNALVYNHTLNLPNSATPSVEAMEYAGWDVENGRHQEFYIRCKDANGNMAPMNFIIEFCVEDSPDTKAPEILGTNYLQEAYIQYEKTSVPLEIYTDEPATCKWDYQDLNYDDMNYGMDFCSENAQDYLYTFTYGCKGNLSGLKDRVENIFYIRCKDKPWWQEGDKGKRYANRESYKLTLKGTQPLVIDWVKPEDGSVIKDSTDSIKITLEARTSAGADEGKAKCQYKEAGGKFYYFYNNGNKEYTYENTQKLWLSEGDYEYFIKCCDFGNNCDNKTINFKVETDTLSPVVARAYHEEKYLKLVTNEPARCVYDTKYESYPCDYSFDDGTSMTTLEDVNHYTNWNTQTTFYIKCQDEYGNQPEKCSKIIRPFEVY